MNSPDSSNPQTAELSAADHVTNYLEDWLRVTLRECEGQEQSRFLALVRTADIHTLYLSGHIVDPRVAKDVSKSISVGAELLIPALLKSIRNFEQPLNCCLTSSELAEWASSRLEQAGNLFTAKRLTQGEHYQLTRCVVHSATEISIYKNHDDLESKENFDRNWVNDWDRFQDQKGWADLFQKMNEFGATSRRTFNQMQEGRLVVASANDNLLNVARDLQKKNAQEYVESESFPDDAKLGSLRFGEWKEIAVYIAAQISINFIYISRAAATEKLKPLGLLNLFPRFLDAASVELLFKSSCSSVDSSNVAEVIETFSFDGENIRFQPRTVEFPSPMLLKVPGGYLFTQFGAISNPYWYMVESLKGRYKSDWDANVDKRETEFRADLYSLFPLSGYAFTETNVQLKRENSTVATDIDAAIYERATNTIYLVQLKWPDVISKEWKPRNSRFTNLRDGGVKWIDEINSWLGRMWAKAPSEVLKRLGFHDLGIDTTIAQFRLIVLSRSWTQFSGKEPFDNRAVWVSWTRLRKLLITHRKYASPLDAAWPQLAKPAAGQAGAASLPAVFKFRHMTITVY